MSTLTTQSTRTILANMSILNHVPINGSEFLVMPWYMLQTRATATENVEGTLLKYNTTDGQWSKIMTLHSVMEDRAEIYDAAFDRGSNLLYILTDCEKVRSVFTVDTGSKEIKCLVELTMFEFYGSSMLLIGNHLHILEEDETSTLTFPRHWIFDKKSGGLLSNHTNLAVGTKQLMLWNFRYSKMRNSIIACGNDAIYECPLATNTWSELTWCKSLIYYDKFSITRDGRYLLALGRNDKRDGEPSFAAMPGFSLAFMRFFNDVDPATDKVVVLDLKNETWRLSPVRCPRKGKQTAIMMGSDRQDQLLTRGFIRRLFKTPSFCKVQFIPEVLIRLVANHVSNELIHLRAGVTTKWLNVDELLKLKD